MRVKLIAVARQASVWRVTGSGSLRDGVERGGCRRRGVDNGLMSCAFDCPNEELATLANEAREVVAGEHGVIVVRQPVTREDVVDRAWHALVREHSPDLVEVVARGAFADPDVGDLVDHRPVEYRVNKLRWPAVPLVLEETARKHMVIVDASGSDRLCGDLLAAVKVQRMPFKDERHECLVDRLLPWRNQAKSVGIEREVSH